MSGQLRCAWSPMRLSYCGFMVGLHGQGARLAFECYETVCDWIGRASA